MKTLDSRVREISKYIGVIDYACKKCGAVTHVDLIDVKYKAGKRGNPIISAYCPDCGAYIKRMRNSKQERIFWKGSMHNIQEFDISLLMWMLQIDYIKDSNTLKAVKQYLTGKIVTNKTIEPMSVTEQRIITTKKEIKSLRDKQGELIKSKDELNHVIIMDSHSWDAMKTGVIMKKMAWYKREINSIAKDIYDKESTL